MLWSPWEAVPECSPQIQAWDYLGGYYIRCRGNFRDSELSEPLGFGWNPTTCLPLLTSSSFIHWDARSRKHHSKRVFLSAQCMLNNTQSRGSKSSSFPLTTW